MLLITHSHFLSTFMHLNDGCMVFLGGAFLVNYAYIVCYNIQQMSMLQSDNAGIQLEHWLNGVKRKREKQSAFFSTSQAESAFGPKPVAVHPWGRTGAAPSLQPPPL